jgi:hypothetical protein
MGWRESQRFSFSALGRPTGSPLRDTPAQLRPRKAHRLFAKMHEAAGQGPALSVVRNHIARNQKKTRRKRRVLS